MAVSTPDPAPLQIQFFGPFAVRVHGRPLASLRTRKGEWLLALLVLRAGHKIEREWLAGTLWPDSGEEQALANLRTSLKDLRRVLGAEARRVSAPTTRSLTLDLAGAAVDVLAFDVAIARGDPASLEEAVALYRGPLLEGCAEEWVFPEQQSRAEGYLRALEALAAQALAAGDPSAAEQHLRRVVAADPLRETAQRELMQSLAAGGSYPAAVQVYRELRLRLHREMNSEPDPETTALFQQLRAAARAQATAPPSAGRRPAVSGMRAGEGAPEGSERADDLLALPRLADFPHNLPLQLSRFIGQERALAGVKALLVTHRLVTLTGVGGGGKSRLALQVAADRLSSFPDGVWLVELAPVRDPALVLPAVAAVFGVRGQPGQPLLAALTAFLRTQHLLLVLDNFEQVLAAAPQVFELLAGAPQVTVLATSRAPLRLQGEQEYPVPPLDVPDPGGLPLVETLSQVAAVALFLQQAQSVQPEFALTEENAAAVVAICRWLDGLPLAIELAAARVKLFSPAALLTRLVGTGSASAESQRSRSRARPGGGSPGLHLLTGGCQDRPARHQTLRAAIAWSYELLAEEEQLLFRRLSVFAGGCTLAAAEAVGEGCGHVLDGVTALVNQSLLKQEEQEDGEPRFSMLETIREFGRECLAQSEEEELARQRHRDYFLEWAEGAESEAEGQGQRPWLGRLEGEQDNLRAALDWCVERGDAEAGLRLGGALSEFWMVRGYLTEGRERLTKLLSLPGAEARTAARGRALKGSGALTYCQGDYQATRALYEESLTIFRELGDQQGIARALGALANMTHFQGDYQGAHVLREECQAIFRELGDQQGIARTLGARGHVARSQGDYPTARVLLEESLAIFRDLGDQRGIAYALRALGSVARERGEYEAARGLLEKSLAIGRELGDQHHIVLSLSALGHAAREAGEYARCAAYYRESLALRQSRDDRLAVAMAVGDFAGLAERQGQWERAVRLLSAAEGAAQPLGRSLLVAVPEEYQRTRDGARAALDEAAFAAAWAAGQAMSLAAAITDALEEANNAEVRSP